MIRISQVETICPEICLLGECPNWNVDQQKLHWTDIKRYCLWNYDYIKKTSEIFWQGSYQIGGFAFTKKDDIVLCTDKGVFILEKQRGYANPPRRLLEISLKKEEMFNDIIVDPIGRIIAGTLDRKNYNGSLYKLEKEKEPVLLMDGIQCSNGMAFSMDKQYFYHTDSKKYSITKFKYDVSTGDISHPIPFYQVDKSQGLPDGMTIDIEGYIWSAFWGSHTVRRFSPVGKMVHEVTFPAKQVTSVTFGGRNMDKIFVTSACQGADDPASGYNKDGTFLGGPTYMYTPGRNIRGRPEWLADF